MGKCYATGLDESKDPQIATIFNRNLFGNFQFNQNLKVRYFSSPESCTEYIQDYLKETAGFLDVNMWDSAACHSAVTGKKTAYAANSLFNGIAVKIENRSPDAGNINPVSYIGTTYLRNIFGNLSREKVTHHQSQIACERYVRDFLKEAENPLDLNALDSATCMPESGTGATIKYSKSSSRSITVSGP